MPFYLYPISASTCFQKKQLQNSHQRSRVTASFEKHRIKLINNGKIVGTGSKFKRDSTKCIFSNQNPNAASAASTNSIQTWNKCPGHISFSTLKKMNKGDFFNGLIISNPSDQPPFCGGSVFGIYLGRSLEVAGANHVFVFQPQKRGKCPSVKRLRMLFGDVDYSTVLAVSRHNQIKSR